MKKREQFKSLAKNRKYLFHGSGSLVRVFQPRQAYTYKKGKRFKDGKPAVYATHLSQVAAFMALMTKKNFPDHFNCGYAWSDTKVKFHADKHTLRQIKRMKKMVGYVYVLEKVNFSKRNKIEWVAFEKIRPVKKIKIGKEWLPRRIELKAN